MPRLQSAALPEHGPPPTGTRGLGQQAFQSPAGVGPTAPQASRHDPGGIEHESIPGPEQARQVRDREVLEIDATTVVVLGVRKRHHQETRGFPRLGGMIGDEGGIEIEVEVVGAEAHRGRW